MRQAKFRGWEFSEICRPFKLALSHNVPFLSLSTSHFLKFRASTYSLSVYYMSLFLVSVSVGRAHCRLDSGSLNRHSHEFFDPVVWVQPCDYACSDVHDSAIADSHRQTHY